MSADPYDLGPASFKGPVPKGTIDGGIGKKKAKKPLTAEFIEAKAEKSARKAKCSDGCRLCPNPSKFRIEPHHIVRRGAPHFGGWHVDNIMGLCLECHTKNHDGDVATKKALRLALTRAEVDHAEDKAFQGYVDKFYWPLPKDARGQTVVAGEIVPELNVAGLARNEVPLPGATP